MRARQCGWGSALLFCACVTTAPAHAETAAGTRITNIASANFLLGNQPSTLSSNMVSTCVAEKLDLLLQAKTTSGNAWAGFSITNTGNGPESFVLTTKVDDRDIDLPIRIDADGDGLFDPAVDSATITARVTPQIAAGEALHLLVIKDPATVAGTGTLTLVARADTGGGAAGTSFEGKGENGCDAVAGTRATSSISTPLNRSAAPATFVKSQEVQAPDGSATARSGATITYRLEVQTSVSGVLRGAFVTDATPTGTDYLPGSMRLDDVPLSDNGDGDAGHFDGAQVRIALGDMPQETRRVVTFQVKIR